jgi:uncharacterized protein (DUF433 family)
MRATTRQVIDSFIAAFPPQEISVAEVMVSRFLAGETPTFISEDYRHHTVKDVLSAIRFFLLLARGNSSVRVVYDRFRTLAHCG